MSSRITDALSSVPPLRVEHLLPIVVILTLWIGLQGLGLAQDTGFVVVLVLGQTYAIWRNLPTAAAQLQQPGRDRSSLLYWPVGIMIVSAVSQLLVSEPLFSQRILSGVCLFVLMIMVLGMRRETQVIDRVATNAKLNGEAAIRVSLLRVNAITAVTVLLANEFLIQADSLTVWMTGMALFAMMLHGIYWFMILMVLPPDDQAAVS